MVIIAKDETASIIGVLSDIVFQALPEIVADDAALSFEWHLFAIWQMPLEDRQRRWEQRIRLVNQAGQTVRIDSIAEFHAEGDKEIHRMIATVPFFPIVPAGQYHLEISFREVGQNDWTPVHRYPFTIRR